MLFFEFEDLTNEIIEKTTNITNDDIELEKKKQELEKITTNLTSLQQNLLILTKEEEKLNGEKNIIKERSKYDAEDVKVHDIPVKSVDLIQENNMDRFERRGKNSGKNQNKKRPNNQQKPDNRPAENQGDRKKKSFDKAVQPAAKSPQQKPKNFKKKPQPKRDDNA